jgi:subtilisin family serine protease
LLHGGDRAVVAAAGNDGVHDRPHWPAAFAGSALGFASQVIAVAAHDGTGLCAWSNTGPWVDMSAPGSNIVSTYVNHADFPTGFAQWSGTSFAAPYVVAAIAASHSTGSTVAAAVDDVKVRARSGILGGYPSLT